MFGVEHALTAKMFFGILQMSWNYQDKTCLGSSMTCLGISKTSLENSKTYLGNSKKFLVISNHFIADVAASSASGKITGKHMVARLIARVQDASCK